MVRIYTDTNLLRYFGQAFATRSLPEDLPVQLLLSPLALMELLSQLGTPQAQETFDAIHALPRVHNQGSTRLLPWSDDFFRLALFNQPASSVRDSTTSFLNQAVNNLLRAEGPEGFRGAGERMRELLTREKEANASNFANLLDSWRAEGPLTERDHQAIFARSIASKAGIDENSVETDQLVVQLNAHYTFEKRRLETAAADRNYNPLRHMNDVFDSELLIYLADPSLHLLTCDRGFRRALQSTQSQRIHIETLNALQDADRVIDTLRRIVRSADEKTAS